MMELIAEIEVTTALTEEEQARLDFIENGGMFNFIMNDIKGEANE